MRRVEEIIRGVLLFFLNFIKTFAIDLYHALYYRALEYDSELQQTKSPGQRFAIWFAIATVSIVVVLLLLHLLYRFISNINMVKGL